MSFALNFNAQNVAPSVGGGYEILPEGRYTMFVTEAASSGTSANDGSGKLELTLTIVEGPLAGKTMKWNLNLWNNNPEAKAIAEKELSALCHAIGRFQIGPVTDLYNAPFVADIGTRDVPARDPGKPALKFNTVKALFTVQGVQIGGKGGNGAQAPQQATQPTQAPAAQQPAPMQQPATQPAAAGAPAGWGAPAGAAPAQQPAAGGWPGGATQPAQQPAAGPGWAPQAGAAPAGQPQWGQR